MLKYILLGFVNYQPLTGYDLKTLIDGSTGHFWHAYHGQIYSTLHKLEEVVRAEQRKFDGMRILGPNCLGLIVPGICLNASFAAATPQKGHVGFISQSGALCTSVLDWALDEGIGFSYFVSVGNMLDVSMGDLIDYFGSATETQSIILYIESITEDDVRLVRSRLDASGPGELALARERIGLVHATAEGDDGVPEHRIHRKCRSRVSRSASVRELRGGLLRVLLRAARAATDHLAAQVGLDLEGLRVVRPVLRDHAISRRRAHPALRELLELGLVVAVERPGGGARERSRTCCPA